MLERERVLLRVAPLPSPAPPLSGVCQAAATPDSVVSLAAPAHCLPSPCTCPHAPVRCASNTITIISCFRVYLLCVSLAWCRG